MGAGFVLLFCLFLALSLFGISKMRVLAEQTKLIYNHPLTVSNAVLRININIVKIHRSMKDVALAQNIVSIDMFVITVNSLEKEIFNDFQIIKDRYLGQDITHEDALNTFREWKPIRNEVIALMKNGNRIEAADITRGKGARHVLKIEKTMEGLGDFAQNKAAEFLFNANKTSVYSFKIIYLTLAFSMLIGILASVLITKSITRPLRILKNAANKIGSGNLDTSIEINSRDEIGQLANTFNQMAVNLKEITASRDELNSEIADRKEAQENLLRSHNLNQSLLDSLPYAAMLIQYPERVVVNANRFAKEMGAKIGGICHTDFGKDVYVANGCDQCSFCKADEVFEKGEAVITQELFAYDKWWTVYWIPVDKNIYLHYSIDITELKQALNDKDMLIKEIHHRVKNNLLVIQSLLKLQAVSVKDTKTRELLDISQNRVKSMSMIHERLYRSDDLRNIDFSDYARSLTKQLFHSYKTNMELVKLNIDVPKIRMDINLMIPCGLILNELVSNALKYAFSESKGGELYVGLENSTDNSFTLIVKDNGAGMPDDIDIYNTESMGMQIVTGLTKQLLASLELKINNGTEFRITFKEDHSNS